MFSDSTSGKIDEIDRILDGGELEEETTEKLCNLLGSGGNGAGVDVPSVLHLAQHPVVATAVQKRELPEALRDALSDAIATVSALLGEWSGAPLVAQAQRLDRRFQREDKKYRLVRDRLEQQGLEAGAEVLGRYLDTSPAPLFSKQLAADFAAMYDRSADQKGADDRALVADRALVEALKFDEPTQPGDFRRLKQQVDELAEGLHDVEATVQRALLNADADTEAATVAAALAARERLVDQSHHLLTAVIRGEGFASQAAAFGAWLAPSLAKHVLGRFLVDILNDGTPTEDLQAGEQAVRDAIVAARTVLPNVGSPVEEIDQVEQRAEEIAEVTTRAWQFCVECYGPPEAEG